MIGVFAENVVVERIDVHEERNELVVERPDGAVVFERAAATAAAPEGSYRVNEAPVHHVVYVAGVVNYLREQLRQKGGVPNLSKPLRVTSKGDVECVRYGALGVIARACFLFLFFSDTRLCNEIHSITTLYLHTGVVTRRRASPPAIYSASACCVRRVPKRFARRKTNESG